MLFFPHMGALPNTTLVTDPILITFEKHLAVDSRCIGNCSRSSEGPRTEQIWLSCPKNMGESGANANPNISGTFECVGTFPFSLGLQIGQKAGFSWSETPRGAPEDFCCEQMCLYQFI